MYLFKEVFVDGKLFDFSDNKGIEFLGGNSFIAATSYPLITFFPAVGGAGVIRIPYPLTGTQIYAVPAATIPAPNHASEEIGSLPPSICGTGFKP